MSKPSEKKQIVMMWVLTILMLILTAIIVNLCLRTIVAKRHASAGVQQPTLVETSKR